MILSMTGFGDAAQQLDTVHYSVEVRSLNNRYFKATIRLPETIAGLEAELEALLRKRITRGSVTLIVKIYSSDASAAYEVNDSALMAYLDHLETLHAKVASRDHAVNIDLTALLALPGVLRPREDEQNALAKARPIVLELTEKACERLGEMRRSEGRMITQQLERERLAISERVKLIAQRTGVVIEEYHQRLRTRVDELMARAKLKLDEHDLVREVAIFAERSDISEEVARLGNHMEQMKQLLDSDNFEPTGRTLEFLGQEMLREANTIASKSNDREISRTIVEVKGAIDRIKEQVMNAE